MPVPSDPMLTPQHAADHIGVSLAILQAELDAGRIPFDSIDGQPHVHLADLMRYKDEIDAKRHRALEALAEEAQRLKLGY